MWFKEAIEVVLKHEGGFVDDPDDPGGTTKYGVSLRWLKSADIDIDGNGAIDSLDVKGLTLEKAKKLYKDRWWIPHAYGDIQKKRIAIKVFDTAINMGSNRANKILQRSLTISGYPTKVDGIIGHRTLHSVEEANENLVLGAFRALQWCFYQELVRRKPVMAKYEKGWTKRAYS